MQITRDNYEAFLLDMIEGQLTADQELVLRKFLRENPDLDTGHGLTGPDLNPGSIEFPDKDGLKKGPPSWSITRNNFNQFCIAYYEGDLDEDMLEELNRFVSKNPGLEREMKLFGRLKLEADKSIRFAGKHNLKRGRMLKGRFSTVFRHGSALRYLAVAASISILIAIALLVPEFHSGSDGLTITQEPLTTLSGNGMPESAQNELPADIPVEVSRSTADLLVLPSDQRSGRMSRDEIIPVTDDSNLFTDYHTRDQLLQPLTSRDPVRVESLNANTATLIHLPGKPQERQNTQSGSIVGTLTGFLARAFDEDHDREPVTVWDIANAGVKGLNTIAGTDIRLEREFDQDGELVSMALNSRIIEFQRTRRNIQD